MLVDSQRGTLLGLAIGDALGAAVEFRPPGSFPEVTGYRGGGPHGLAPGEWTDDSSMALAMAASLASGRWDLDDQARRYLFVVREGVVLGERSLLRYRHHLPQSPSVASPGPGTPRPPAIPRSTPAATARSCDWPRCRSATPTSIPTDSPNWSCC